MKIMYIIFVFLVYSVLTIMVINDNADRPVITFPTIDIPSFEFRDLSGGCGGFVDCIEYVGAVLFNIGLGIIFLVLFIVNLFVFLFALIALLLKVAFTGINGAPWWFNTIIVTLFLGSISIIVYRLTRSGASND